MDQLKRLRVEKGLSQARLAARAGLDPSTVNQIERGAREASPVTLRKLADALDISIAGLLEEESYPKAQAPLPLENGPAGLSEAEQRLSYWWVDALETYIEARIDKYEAEISDPQSLHFGTATAATLWVAQVEEEAAMWSDWVRNRPLPVSPSSSGEGRQLLDFGVLSMVLTTIGEYAHVANLGKLRIEAMNDKPDELATRRLAKASAEAQEGRERLEELRHAASD